MTLTASRELLEQPQYQQLTAAVEWIVREEITDPSATVRWDVDTDERKSPVLVLALSDQLGGQAAGRFAPSELRQESLFRERVRELHDVMRRLGDWRHNRLPALYQDIRQWSARVAPPCVVRDLMVDVEERATGRYTAPALDLVREADVVAVRPIAVQVVLADGRVDVAGPTDSYVLFLRDNKWIVMEPTSRIAEAPFSEELFHQMLEELRG